MLDTLRNSARGTAGKIIVGLIVLTFVLFGAESIISIAGNSAPATVNGDDISEIEYQRLLASRQQELVNQFGAEMAAQLANSAFLQQDVINSLVNQTLQTQLAATLSFTVGEEQILSSLADIPAFQIDGQFDQNQYLNVLAANGYDHNSFMAAQQVQNSLTQLQAGIANSAFIVEKSVRKLAQLNAQQRSIAYKEFTVEDYVESVNLTEDDLQAYYQSNSANYVSDEQIKVNYLIVSVDDIAQQMIATDTELQSAYDSYLAEVRADETREISHILFADGDDVVAQAQQALDRINTGEDFAELASELSDDPGSAEFGGSLGVLIEGIYVDEFYDAAIALQQVGDVTGLVETEYGVHLIKLDALSSLEADSFEDKVAELTEEIQQRKARDEMLIVESQLADEAFTSDSIAQVAEQFQVDLNTSDWLTRTNSDSVFSQPNAVQSLFSLQVLEDDLISDVVRLANGDLLVLQKEDYRPEDIRPLAEVLDEVTQSLTQQRANEIMLEAIRDAAQSTLEIDDRWTVAESIVRSNDELPPAVVNAGFSLPHPQAGSISVSEVEGDNVAYVVALTQVIEASPNENNQTAAESFADRFTSSSQYQIVFNNALDSADIQIRR